jgi:hypothetical protein
MRNAGNGPHVPELCGSPDPCADVTTVASLCPVDKEAKGGRPQLADGFIIVPAGETVNLSEQSPEKGPNGRE